MYNKMATRFITTFYFTKNSQSFNIDIPYTIDIPSSKFIISGISGAMKADGSFINVVIPELTIQNIYNSTNNSHNIVATNVLNVLASKPTNRTVSTIDIGFPMPNGINNQSASFTIQLLDEKGDLYFDADIDWVAIEMTIWNH
jgi:hypothetical protein